jgi:hypothetical protein
LSRMVIAALVISVILSSSVGAQKLSDTEIKTQIEKQRRMVAADQYGCAKYPSDDEIVVCGPNLENERQKLPQGPVDKDRIRRGEAVSTTRAAERSRSGCGIEGINIGCTQLPKNTMSFGKPPPPMPPDYADVVRGLPEPEDVVSEGGN